MARKNLKFDEHVFDRILAQGAREGRIPAKSEAARNWFRDRAKEVGVEEKITNSKLLKENNRTRLRTNLEVGSLYCYTYQAKHEATLPYYDRFPLVFVMETYPDGSWLGLNLHYLPIRYRAVLMDALYSITNNERYDQTTKLMITYQLMKNATKYKWFRPCIKKYLRPQLRSKFIKIFANEWDVALFLPLAAWHGANATKVYSDSIKKVNK